MNFAAQEIKKKKKSFGKHVLVIQLQTYYYIASYAKMVYKNKWKECFMSLLFPAFTSLWIKGNNGMWHCILWSKMSSWDPDLAVNLFWVWQAWYTMKVVVTSSLYSHGTLLYQSNPAGDHWLKFFTVFVIFLCQMMRQCINAGCDHFLTYWFQLSHCLSFHAVYSLCLIYLALANVRTVVLCSIQMNMFIVIT